MNAGIEYSNMLREISQISPKLSAIIDFLIEREPNK